MPLSQQALQYVDVPLSVTSQPTASLQLLDMPWAKRVMVDAKRSRYTIGVDRSVMDATRGGRSYARASGARHPRIKRGTVSTLTGVCVEHSPADDLDGGDLDRALDPFRPEINAALRTKKIAMLERYVETRDLLVTAANWNGSATSTLAGLGLGASGVQLSSDTSLPFVDMKIASNRCAALNDGIRPHFMIMGELSAQYMAAKGARTSLPTNKDPIREITEEELQTSLGRHLGGCDVYIERAREGGSLLWGNDIVFGYYPTDVVLTEDGFDVAPSTFALIHEKIPSLGINGEMAVKRVENEEKTGVMIAAMTSYKAQKIDDLAIFLVTAGY
jgi:hypothetical protein